MALNRFYYPTKYRTRAEVIFNGVTCVFISHQKKDKDQAKKVADYLINAGVDVYFDEYDTDLKIQKQTGKPNDVTQAICNGINNSSHMVIVVSPNTLTSSWVPFEIGYGYEKTDLGVLCLKGIPKGALPEYIRAAPVIRDIYDLNSFVEKITKKPKERLIETKMLSDYNSGMNLLYGVMDPLINDKY